MDRSLSLGFDAASNRTPATTAQVEARTVAVPLPTMRDRALAPVEGYFASLGVVGVATAVGAALAFVGLTDAIVMIYLLAVLVAAWRIGRGPAAFAAVVGAAAHAYFFVPPEFSFAIVELPEWLTLATLLLVGLVVGTLTARLRSYGEDAERRATRSDLLRACAAEMGGRRDIPSLLALVARQIGRHLAGRASLVLDEPGRGTVTATDAGVRAATDEEASLAARVRERPDPAAEPQPDGRRIVVPLRSDHDVLGAVVIVRHEGSPSPAELALLADLSRLASEAVVRARLAEQAQRAEIEVQTERLRNALLSSVSHDFRTPLGVILAATTHLADNADSLPVATRTELARTAASEAERMNRLIADLLSMTRLEAGAVRAAKEWQSVEDVVGAVVGRMDRALAGRVVTVSIPADLPLVPLDAVLVEQLITNVLDNAARHTPSGTPIDVTARATADHVELEIADRGGGIAAGDEDHVFERFRRGGAQHADGVGLGLAVCRGIAQAHGGTITAQNRAGGGASFRCTLPLDGPPPRPLPAETA